MTALGLDFCYKAFYCFSKIITHNFEEHILTKASLNSDIKKLWSPTIGCCAFGRSDCSFVGRPSEAKRHDVQALRIFYLDMNQYELDNIYMDLYFCLPLEKNNN